MQHYRQMRHGKHIRKRHKIHTHTHSTYESENTYLPTVCSPIKTGLAGSLPGRLLEDLRSMIAGLRLYCIEMHYTLCCFLKIGVHACTYLMLLLCFSAIKIRASAFRNSFNPFSGPTTCHWITEWSQFFRLKWQFQFRITILIIRQFIQYVSISVRVYL